MLIQNLLSYLLQEVKFENYSIIFIVGRYESKIWISGSRNRTEYDNRTNSALYEWIGILAQQMYLFNIFY